MYWDTRYRLRRAIFSTVNIRQTSTPRGEIPPDCGRLAEKLALEHLDCFPGLFYFMPLRSIEEALEREPACVASKVCQLDDPARVVVLLSMLSGEIYLRLKPCLVVKISSDVVTKHFCQVCILFLMLCRSDCWLCTYAVSDHGDCAIKQLVGPGSSEYHVVWLHLGRPTWDTKEIFFTFDFHILHWQRHIGAIIFSPCWPIFRSL